MRRFFVEEIKERGGYVVISGPEARHISRVLRMSMGDHFILMDRKGSRFEAVIESSGPKELHVRLAGVLPMPASPPVDIILCQALLKSRAMDCIIEKSSELGVNEIIPFFSERTVIRDAKSGAEGRARRWREIAQGAAKQSDRIRPAEIYPPVSFREVTGRYQNDDSMKVILWEREESTDLKRLLKAHPSSARFVGMVGPEGGFTGMEIDMAREAGFMTVSVGRRILRAETAAVILVAIVQYEWGDLGRDNL
ncbi:MAG TPA: RsmE family RNA methyltransferase [Desulfatiglandales bacterium]|nr:RsmE family RNA methyltransferase [Desulfatiglandales bacterium]